MSIIMVGLYRPPPSCNCLYEELQVIITGCNWEKEVILCGDFDINWLDKSNSKRLKQITSSHNFSQVREVNLMKHGWI